MLLRMGLLLRLGPNVITDGTFITLGSSYYTCAFTVRRSQRTWYFPHHGMFDLQKQDKIRVVFDAASLHDGFSPNNQLLQGPDLPNSLLGILLWFRQYPVALVADIEGMFNQVKVPPENSDALRLHWWKDRGLERSSKFLMTSHIFGTTDSPS